MSSKVLIAQQVLYRLYGGIPDANAPVQEADVIKALEQKINSRYKMQYFAETLPSGDTVPENLMLATYEGVAVTSFANGVKSKATLPVMPISLPRGMGVFAVYNPDYPDNLFVPVAAGARALLKSTSIINALSGKVLYEIRNNELWFDKDLPILGCEEVDMTLAVLDVSTLSNTDPLPIPADFEDTLVKELVSDFAPVQGETGQVANFQNITQQPTKQ